MKDKECWRQEELNKLFTCLALLLSGANKKGSKKTRTKLLFWLNVV